MLDAWLSGQPTLGPSELCTVIPYHSRSLPGAVITDGYCASGNQYYVVCEIPAFTSPPLPSNSVWSDL